MDVLETLVRRGNSELQRLMRASLRGLLATLEDGLESLPGDPAAADGRECVERIKLLLQSTGESSALQQTSIPLSRVGEERSREIKRDWSGLLQEWQRAAEWQTVADSSTPPTMSPRDLWFLTLRVPPDVAKNWQEGWYQTRGNSSAEATDDVLAGPLEQVLLPAYEESSVEIRLSPSGRVPDILNGSDLGPLAKGMVLPVAACLAWIDHDRSLRHMLRSLFRFGTASLEDGHRSRFRNALIERFQALRDAETERDPVQVVLAWVAVDEAVHSLLHQPPANLQSAFAKVGKASRSLIAAVRDFAYASDAEVHLQALAGQYAHLRGLTEPEADVETAKGGSAGDVVLCTRLFLRLKGTSYPGRVIYRPR